MVPDFLTEVNSGSTEEAISATRKSSIASLTVAYNGASVLARQLEALKRQTRKLDEVIVVNNASTDDTVKLLATEYPGVTVLNLPENGGVGGGYAAGLAYAALTKEYDWVWLFDQDSVPSVDGLERLLQGLEHLGSSADSAAILAPVCVHSRTKLPCPGLSWRDGRMLPTPGDSTQPVTLVDLVISSGSLVRRQAIEAVGLPRADFFMDFVDYELCLRLRRHGFKIAVVRDSHLDHVLGDPSKFQVLGRTTLWTDHAPWRMYYMIRNQIYTVWQYYPKWSVKGYVLYRWARHALFLLLFGKRKLACLGMMYRGLLDGRAGRLGIRFCGIRVDEKSQVEVAT
jgi:GT2 family glycosyltransferase